MEKIVTGLAEGWLRGLRDSVFLKECLQKPVTARSAATGWVRHREERSDAAIHKFRVGKQKWIASLRSP